ARPISKPQARNLQDRSESSDGSGGSGPILAAAPDNSQARSRVPRALSPESGATGGAARLPAKTESAKIQSDWRVDPRAMSAGAPSAIGRDRRLAVVHGAEVGNVRLAAGRIGESRRRLQLRQRRGHPRLVGMALRGFSAALAEASIRDAGRSFMRHCIAENGTATLFPPTPRIPPTRMTTV